MQERQSQAATSGTSELSSFSLTELPVDQSGPLTVIHRPYVPLSTSMPVHVPSDNQQTTETTQNENSFQQVILNISQQSLYLSLVAMGTLTNTSISPSIPFFRRVINDTEEHQRRVLNKYIDSITRGTYTSPLPDSLEQEQKVVTPIVNLQVRTPQLDMQEETLQLESLELEDTGIKQAHIANDKNLELAETLKTGDIDIQALTDNNDSQAQDDDANSQLSN